MLSSHNLIVTPTHYRDHHSILSLMTIFFFFFNDTATTEIYTLSLHDALPISCQSANNSTFDRCSSASHNSCWPIGRANPALRDRKSTRLNSSHSQISYAVFCLKKKKHHGPRRDITARRVVRRRSRTAPFVAVA